MSNVVETDLDGPVLHVALASPHTGNALSAAVVERLHEACARVEGDADIRAVVLRSSGRHFCTGFDLATLDQEDDAGLAMRFIRIEQLLARVWSLPVPTIALARGRTMGAGADLFAACQRRIALDGASFRFPGADFGVVLGTRRLVRRCGQAGLELIESGAEIDAERAGRIGLAGVIIGADAEEAAVESAIAEAVRLPRTTLSALRAASGEDAALCDRDLASLVRSVVVPGLRDRIAAHRDRQRLAREAPAQVRNSEDPAAAAAEIAALP